MRILLHPGFHKTGTTSLQYALARQAEALAPHLRMLLPDDLGAPVTAARRHSVRPAPRRLDVFETRLVETLTRFAPDDPRPVIITCETLLGWIPGRKDNWDYDAAPELMERAVRALRARFGDAAEILVWFTTRAGEDWQRSVYWQNLRAMRITEDFETYRHRLARAARHDDVVAATARRLAGQARVLSSPIEEIGGGRLGPLGHALDLLEVPSDGLSPQTAFNVQPPGAADELLALNRSSLDDAEVARARHALVQKWRKRGKTRRRLQEG